MHRIKLRGPNTGTDKRKFKKKLRKLEWAVNQADKLHQYKMTKKEILDFIEMVLSSTEAKVNAISD